MLTLFFSPGSCSLAAHIVLVESGLPFQNERVNLSTKTFKDHIDFKTRNPKGSVPALQLNNNQVLTENAVIMQYISDLVPEKNLTLAAGTLERYRVMEWLNFITTEVHKNFTPLFHPKISEDVKSIFRDILAQKLSFIAKSLGVNHYLMGNTFTAADAYLFVVLRWCNFTKVDLVGYPVIQTYIARVAARSSVMVAMRAEGLIK